MKVVINMSLDRKKILSSLLLVILFVCPVLGQAQNRDQLPAEFREYTNPEEVVTFDRSTTFQRALDVINEFAQKYRKKMVIDRTETDGKIGISVPPMHWMDALKLILRVKNRAIRETKEFYEIVTLESQKDTAQQTRPAATKSGKAEGPVATTKTHEVRINAVFFEGNRRALQEIGVDWSTISENVPDAILGGGEGGQGGGRGGQGGQGNQQGRTQLPSSQFGEGPFVQVNSKGAKDVSQQVFDAIINVGEIGNTGINVQALFSAFEADNLGEILASPTIKVMDGEDGRIQVGQDFSIKRRDIAGNVIEDFFSVGTILEVTPQVVEQNDTTFIHLNIKAERSTAQPDPVSTIINKQEATTQALLLDGETTAIAGLYSTEQSEVRRGVPILKDLPGWFFGLRYLFGYTSKDTDMRELVVLLQASLEPTIPERYNEEGNYKDKYEVLQEERQGMRQEIRDSEKARETESGFTPDKLQGENTDKEHEKKQEQEPKDLPEMQNEKEGQEKNAQPESMDEKKQKEQKKPAIEDPEVETKEIPLDLGGGEKNIEAKSIDNIDEPKEEKQQQVDQAAKVSKRYYIVGGSFKNHDNAVAFRDRLVNQGYGDAALIQKKDNGWSFVVFNAYNNVENARQSLNNIQSNYPDAWLYKVK